MAEQDAGIHAAGDLSIRSGQDTLGNANTSQSKAIGTVQISDTEKFSGWHRQQHEDDRKTRSRVHFHSVMRLWLPERPAAGATPLLVPCR